jgi:hypothetical protein
MQPAAGCILSAYRQIGLVADPIGGGPFERIRQLQLPGLWQFHAIAVRLAPRGKPVPYFVLSHGMPDPWFRHRYPLKHIKKNLYWLVGDYWVLRNARLPPHRMLVGGSVKLPWDVSKGAFTWDRRHKDSPTSSEDRWTRR